MHGTFVAMAKDAERGVAYVMFVEQGLSRKEIAERLKVREKTVGDWATKGLWESLRAAHLTNTQNVVRTLSDLIATYAEQLNEMERERGSNPKEKARIVDAMVKVSKTLEVTRGEGDITLSHRVRVMDWIFTELQKHDATVHLKLVEFQTLLLEEAARLHE